VNKTISAALLAGGVLLLVFAAIERCDGAEISPYMLPTISDGVKVFYRTARCGQSTQKERAALFCASRFLWNLPDHKGMKLLPNLRFHDSAFINLINCRAFS
jgi:hypothetical protein